MIAKLSEVQHMRVLKIVPYLALGLLVWAIIDTKTRFFLTVDMPTVVSNLPDDAAYFYKIAWNVAHGKGFTFDGINPTNGFQPLWLYVLVPLAWLMRSLDVETYFRLATAYQSIFVVVAGIVLFSSLRMIAPIHIALVGSTIFFLFGRGFVNGMETGVFFLCLAALLGYSLKYRVFWHPRTSAALGFGVLLGLLLLARLDSIFIILATYIAAGARLFTAWHAKRSNDVLVRNLAFDVALSLLSLIVVIAPYFIYNKIAFGAFMPISGQLKNSFPHIVQPEFGLSRFGLRELAIVFVSAAFCLWAIIFRRKLLSDLEDKQYFYIITVISASATVMHYLNTAFFMKWAVFGWHFASYFFTLSLVATAVLLLTLQRSFAQYHFLVQTGALMCALVVAGYIFWKAEEQYKRYGWKSVAYEAGTWVHKTFPQNAVFAMKDAGVFGLFSQRSVINLDGLVNNMEYQEALRQKRLNEYLARKGVQYIVQHAMWGDPMHNQLALSGIYEYIDMPYKSQLYGTLSDPVRVYREDEVFRKVYHEKMLGIDTVFVIWKLRNTHTVTEGLGPVFIEQGRKPEKQGARQRSKRR